MRKFAFFLAIVAVFAMSACAFAVDGDISDFTIKAADRGNVGKLNQKWAASPAASMDVSANLYYAPVDVANQSLVANFSATTPSGTTALNVGSTSVSAAATISPDQLGQGAAVTPTLTGTLLENSTADVVYTIPSVNLSKIPALATAEVKGIGGYSAAGFSKSGLSAFANVTLNLTPVVFVVDDVEIDTDAKDPTSTLVATADGKDIVEIADKDNIVLESKATGVVEKAALSTDLKTIELTLPTTVKTGKARIVVKAKEGVTVSEDKDNNKIKIAGLDASGVEVTSFDVIITIAPNQKTDKASYTFVIDQPEDLVVSTDMVSTDIKSIMIDGTELVNSADIVTSADVTGGTLLTFDAVALSDLFGDITARQTVDLTISDNADLTAATKLAKATIVVEPAEEPVYPEYETTPAQQAAIEEIIASPDLGLAGATGHNAISTNVDDTLTAARISDDVRGYFSISQTVATAGDYVAIDGSNIVARPDTNESVTFYKNFGSATDPDRVSLAAVTSGDVLQAAVLIVDNVCPANLQGAQRSAKDTNKGLVIRTASNGTKVVVIYDGNRNSTVSDPIEARVNRWHSSSSSCSMGFGLAAVAGLAALALRKRSK